MQKLYELLHRQLYQKRHSDFRLECIPYELPAQCQLYLVYRLTCYIVNDSVAALSASPFFTAHFP
jgi:hypothetical protein